MTYWSPYYDALEIVGLLLLLLLLLYGPLTTETAENYNGNDNVFFAQYTHETHHIVV